MDRTGQPGRSIIPVRFAVTAPTRPRARTKSQRCHVSLAISDAMIAGTALAHGATVDFMLNGVQVFLWPLRVRAVAP